jgi:small-conductance mechanosensitive channel
MALAVSTAASAAVAAAPVASALVAVVSTLSPTAGPIAAQGGVARNLVSRNVDVVLLGVILLVGVLVAYLVARAGRRLLVAAGVGSAVEGTASERAARRLGTSVVSVLAWLLALFVFLVFAVLALGSAALLDYRQYLRDFIDYLPGLFLAVLVLIVGLVVADKVELLVSERLRGIKIPSVGVLPALAKYSVIFVAALIALGQLGVATAALVVVLGAYCLALVVLGGLACKDLLAAGAAGIYLLLNEPYAIGDEVRIDDTRGVVQEVDVFVTRVESDGEEFVVPNQRVFRSGIVRIRE